MQTSWTATLKLSVLTAPSQVKQPVTWWIPGRSKLGGKVDSEFRWYIYLYHRLQHCQKGVYSESKRWRSTATSRQSHFFSGTQLGQLPDQQRYILRRCVNVGLTLFQGHRANIESTSCVCWEASISSAVSQRTALHWQFAIHLLVELSYFKVTF